jgi:hypothetical protein
MKSIYGSRLNNFTAFTDLFWVFAELFRVNPLTHCFMLPKKFNWRRWWWIIVCNIITGKTLFQVLYLDTKLTWGIHIKNTVLRLDTELWHLLRRESKTPTHLKRLIYTLCIEPIWQYSYSIWNSASHTHIHKYSKTEYSENRFIHNGEGCWWWLLMEHIHNDLM